MRSGKPLDSLMFYSKSSKWKLVGELLFTFAFPCAVCCREVRFLKVYFVQCRAGLLERTNCLSFKNVF